MKTPSISILGNGNIAYLFSSRLLNSGIVINSVSTRNKAKGSLLAKKLNCKFETINEISGELILICVNDDSVIEIINNLPSNKMIAYCSAIIDLNEITHPNCGVFYPLQTVTSKLDNSNLKFPILIESKTTELKSILCEIGEKISAKVEYIKSDERIKIHLIATFLNNFSNHLIYIGQKYAVDQKIPLNIFNDLIQETFNKINSISAYNAQTGPAKRNDLNTIEKHLDLLPDELKNLYTEISKSINKTYN